MTLVGRKKKLR